MLVGVYAFDFLQQSFFHHFIHALVNALVKLFTVACEANFDDLKRTFFGVAGAE